MSDLEEKFQAAVDAHKEEMSELYEELVALSEKHGIPFGQYVPKSFHKKFGNRQDADGNWVSGVDIGTVMELCDVDAEYWQSSKFECEVFNGGY